VSWFAKIKYMVKLLLTNLINLLVSKEAEFPKGIRFSNRPDQVLLPFKFGNLWNKKQNNKHYLKLGI